MARNMYTIHSVTLIKKCLALLTLKNTQLSCLFDDFDLKCLLRSIDMHEIEYTFLLLIFFFFFFFFFFRDNICKHLFKNLFLLSRLGRYVDSDARKIFFQAHLLSHINYASSVWTIKRPLTVCSADCCRENCVSFWCEWEGSTRDTRHVC